jgi:hypothetical protein
VLEDDTWRMFAIRMGVVCHVRFMFVVRVNVCSLQQMARVCVKNFDDENKFSLLHNFGDFHLRFIFVHVMSLGGGFMCHTQKCSTKHQH